jgi:hypothetical protein
VPDHQDVLRAVNVLHVVTAICSLETPNSRAFSGEPSERSERPERKRGRRVRCNAMLGSRVITEPNI